MITRDEGRQIEEPLQRRLSTMPDGRYLYYYTFESDSTVVRNPAEGATGMAVDKDDIAEDRDV